MVKSIHVLRVLVKDSQYLVQVSSFYLAPTSTSFRIFSRYRNEIKEWGVQVTEIYKLEDLGFMWDRICLPFTGYKPICLSKRIIPQVQNVRAPCLFRTHLTSVPRSHTVNSHPGQTSLRQLYLFPVSRFFVENTENGEIFWTGDSVAGFGNFLLE